MSGDRFLFHVYTDQRGDGNIDDNDLCWIAYKITQEQLLAIRDILRDDQVEML